MLPQASAKTGATEYQTAKIYSYNGMNRIASAMYLESQPQNLFYFPFITTPVIMGMNVIDDESGAVNKRPGLELYLDNPDNEPVQELIQFTSYSDAIVQQLRISGTSIYKYAYSGNSWGSSIYTLTGSNIRMSHASLNGYLYLSNGVDDFMYYDGVNFYKLVNGVSSTTLSAGLSPFLSGSSQTISVASTSGFNPTTAFIQIGSSPLQEPVTTNEIVKYSGTTSTTFTVPGQGDRSYNNTCQVSQVYSNIASGDTTLNMQEIVGYPTSGYIQIDSEIIQYTGINKSFNGSNPQFTGCTRGAEGTAAASHSAGASFGIYWPSGTDVWVYYGNVPTKPLKLFQTGNRLWAFNTSETGGSSHVWVSSSNGDPTDSFNWIPSYLSQGSGQGTFTGVLDPATCIDFYLDPENGQDIRDVDFVNNQMLVAKSNSLYNIQIGSTGLPTSIVKLSSQFGAPTIHSMTNLQGTAFLLDGWGVLTSNSTTPQLLSYQITDLIQGINSSSLTTVYTAKYNWYVYFSVGTITEAPWFGGATYNNCVLVYNYLTSNWWLWSYPFTINCMSEMYSSADTNKSLYFYMGDTSGNTYTNAGYLSTNNPIYNDNGIDIPIQIKLRYFYFQEPATIKSFRKTTAICENGTNGSIYYSVISGNEQSDWIYLGKLSNFANRWNFPDNESMLWRGIAYNIIESSSSRFRLLGIEQEFEYVYLDDTDDGKTY